MTDTTGAGGTLRDDELIMAIVEAARTCVARHPMGSPHLSARSWLALVEAVEAYEKEQRDD